LYRKLKKLSYVCDFIGDQCFVNREIKERSILSTNKGIFILNLHHNGCCGRCQHLIDGKGCSIKYGMACASTFCFYAYEELSEKEKLKYHKIIIKLNKLGLDRNIYIRRSRKNDLTYLKSL
jgi:hypothetical protein